MDLVEPIMQTYQQTASAVAQMPRVDYDAHPAFARLGLSPAVLSTEVAGELQAANRRIAAIDDILGVDDYVSRGAFGDAVALRRQLWMESEQLIDRLHRDVLRVRTDWTAWELARLRMYFRHMKIEYRRYLRHQLRRLRERKREAARRNERAVAAALGLRKDGAVSFPVDKELQTAILREADPYVRRLRALDFAKPHGFGSMGILPAKRGFWEAVRASLSGLGVDRIASAYLGYPVRLTAIGLHLNVAGNRHFSRRYDDIGLPAAQASGIHFDTSCGMVKAMLYLSDVGPEDGAFSYVLGSNNWHLPYLRRFSGQSLSVCGISLDTSQSRRLFLKLPEPLRQHSHFGADFLAQNEEQARLLESERIFTSDDSCALILFDNNGLHRGGVSPKRDRVAIQLEFGTLFERASDIAYAFVDRHLSPMGRSI
jgi:hypothetical protein